MTWHLPNNFRGQRLVIGIASLSMAALAVILIQDAWYNTTGTPAEKAQQQCVDAVRELQAHFAEHLGALGTSAETLKFDGHNNSLQELSAKVLRSYDGIEGGFILGTQDDVAATGSSSGLPIPNFAGSESRLVMELTERTSASTELTIGNIVQGAELLVGAAGALDSSQGIAWASKRLKGANDPVAERRRWWLASRLVAVLGLGVVVLLSIHLRHGVDTLNKGLARLETDFDYRLSPVGGDFGKVASAINRMADRRGALEGTLRRQDRLAALGKVVAGVAHEIRNPLNSLLLTLELLDRRVQKGSVTGHEVQEAIQEVDRLDQILARLLAFGRPNLQSRRTQDFQPLLERALRVVHDQALRKNVEVKITGGGSQRLRADVDAVAIEQVLINLLLNAIDASPHGGTVRVGTVVKLQELRIEIRDEGSGIPARIREHIFDPYFTTKENGTGLGLAVSREIVCNHGGSLDFESNGEGTTFVIKLPSMQDHN